MTEPGERIKKGSAEAEEQAEQPVEEVQDQVEQKVEEKSSGLMGAVDEDADF